MTGWSDTSYWFVTTVKLSWLFCTRYIVPFFLFFSFYSDGFRNISTIKKYLKSLNQIVHFFVLCRHCAPNVLLLVFATHKLAETLIQGMCIWSTVSETCLIDDKSHFIYQFYNCYRKNTAVIWWCIKCVLKCTPCWGI